MSVFVKICGLRDANTVGAAAAAGANAVGFVFADSVRRVTPAEAKAAAVAMPPDVRRVAVMRHPSNAEWQDVLRSFSPDVLQTDADDFAELDVPDSVERWPVVRETAAFGDATGIGVFVYEGTDSGTGETVDWTKAADVAVLGRMLLAGGLTPANVRRAIDKVRPWGVDVSSGVESAPGVKDIELIREFIGAARAAEKLA